MKTIVASYRVGDLARWAAFYTTLGHLEVGRVVLGNGDSCFSGFRTNLSPRSSSSIALTLATSS